jgi:hypothetical protein
VGGSIYPTTISDWVGIETTTPNSTLQVYGSFSTKVNALSANTTLDATYQVIETTGTLTVTLPTAVGISGRVYTIKKQDGAGGGTLTIATTSAQTIDGATTLIIKSQYVSTTLVSNGTNWIII